MRAVTISEFGGPEVLLEVDLPDPRPARGQVSIDVTHAAVGLVDVLFRRGDLRDAPGDLARTPPFVPGLEVAGTVRELGAGVLNLRVGEPVVTLTRIGQGGYASVAIADASLVISLDEADIDPAHAVAALPNATTALLSLTELTRLRQGETVLVHGAAGGLAVVYPAVARFLGAAAVLGTASSPEKAQAALSLGYDKVLTSVDFPAGLDGQQVDVVIDPVGGPIRTDSLTVLAAMGRLIVVGHASSTPEQPVAGNDLWLSNRGVLGFNVGAYLQSSPDGARAAARTALDLITTGALRIPVLTLGLGRAAEAHQLLESRAAIGRIVLDTRGV